MGILRLFATLSLVALVYVVGQAKSQAVEPNGSGASPWVVGDKAPRAGAIFEAWFDRRVPPNLSAVHEVVVGSPAYIGVWLRTEKQSCLEAEASARRITNADDGSLLYVCAKPARPGDYSLVAAVGAPTLVVSESIKVAAAGGMSPAASAAITTIVGFLIGILTSYVQGLIQLNREEASTRKAAEKSLASVLTDEIFTNSKELQRVIDGGDNPVPLKTPAYNNADKLGPIAWGYLDSPAAVGYRRQIDIVYKTHIPAYQVVVEAWKVAAPADRAKALEQVRTAAAALLGKLSGAKE
jgi:hypothetical protein